MNDTIPASDAAPVDADEFIARWSVSGGGEMANSQSFLIGLCQLLGLPEPEPTRPDEAANRYVFEKAVQLPNGDGTASPGRVDLYRAGCFVLESKQGSERRAAEAEPLADVTRRQKRRGGTATRGTPAWDQAMIRAREQARRYAQAVEGEWPPFLIVCDVGHCFDLYADFTQSGKNYVPFPDPQNYRLRIERLREAPVQALLRAIWTEPFSLDPSRRAAKVTRELAARLAKLATSLEGRAGNSPERVAAFLMRCLFTMFAEDVGLLPAQGFTEALRRIRHAPQKFAPMTGELWKTMNTGGFSNLLLEELLRFNGGLFEDCEALPLSADQLELLIEAGNADWRDVEPAIFGTLLERALTTSERHKLGAHYTPRAYVERLVMPTLIEPLREQWEAAYAAAAQYDEDGDRPAAVRAIRQFHERLCETRVLDPACGSGNFLYVALELMKRLEGEVLNALRQFGGEIPLLTVDPHQFLGIEVNPRAAAITDLVLWIGYLQWHFRTRGQGARPREPVIRQFHNIECRDAVLAWDRVEDVTDEQGHPVTRWDGRTTKPHPVTGEEVPDESARVIEQRYINPRKAEWPQADYIVGNPPFVGTKRMRFYLGNGYVDALRQTYTKGIEDNADLVLFWWYKAAEIVKAGNAKRFGFITTNSISQAFNRRVVASQIEDGISICWAVPDHPWTDAHTGAGVRIAMTIATKESATQPVRYTVIREERQGGDDDALDIELREETGGRIQADLRIGAEVSECVSLDANGKMCAFGVALHGNGFILDPEEATNLRAGGDPSVIKPYLGGRDLLHQARERYVVDFSFLTEEDARRRNPAAFQRIIDRVLPERRENRRKPIREKWWRFAWERPELRKAMNGLSRFIATTETSKHRVFQFVDITTLPDHMIVVIASDDAYILGVVSSAIHRIWSLTAGGTLADRPRYNKTVCFDPFPFPNPSEALKARIRELGEQLDAHRKRQQLLDPSLTMTGMYNVLQKLRAGEPLSEREKAVHERGLVSVLLELHERLDEAVCDAYGWPRDIGEEAVLERLVALNAERAAEEARGQVRYLRPEFQCPGGAKARPVQKDLGITPPEAPAVPAAAAKKQPWPKSLPERITAVRGVLATASAPLPAESVAGHFTRARKTDVAEILETLTALGHVRQTEDGRYVG